ncbi:hypothetical protein Bbelb_301170 [Branchiostoma belcheri]|nr:hypothetical protein Bbelb_301170 [Branchiostoma belcheri]
MRRPNRTGTYDEYDRVVSSYKRRRARHRCRHCSPEPGLRLATPPPPGRCRHREFQTSPCDVWNQTVVELFSSHGNTDKPDTNPTLTLSPIIPPCFVGSPGKSDGPPALRCLSYRSFFLSVREGVERLWAGGDRYMHLCVFSCSSIIVRQLGTRPRLVASIRAPGEGAGGGDINLTQLTSVFVTSEIIWCIKTLSASVFIGLSFLYWYPLYARLANGYCRPNSTLSLQQRVNLIPALPKKTPRHVQKKNVSGQPVASGVVPLASRLIQTRVRALSLQARPGSPHTGQVVQKEPPLTTQGTTRPTTLKVRGSLKTMTNMAAVPEQLFRALDVNPSR